MQPIVSVLNKGNKNAQYREPWAKPAEIEGENIFSILLALALWMNFSVCSLAAVHWDHKIYFQPPVGGRYKFCLRKILPCCVWPRLILMNGPGLSGQNSSGESSHHTALDHARDCNSFSNYFHCSYSWTKRINEYLFLIMRKAAVVDAPIFLLKPPSIYYTFLFNFKHL